MSRILHTSRMNLTKQLNHPKNAGDFKHQCAHSMAQMMSKTLKTLNVLDYADLRNKLCQAIEYVPSPFGKPIGTRLPSIAQVSSKIEKNLKYLRFFTLPK